MQAPPEALLPRFAQSHQIRQRTRATRRISRCAASWLAHGPLGKLVYVGVARRLLRPPGDGERVDELADELANVSSQLPALLGGGLIVSKARWICQWTRWIATSGSGAPSTSERLVANA